MAQNEMKAKPALPERVRSMEGLGPFPLNTLKHERWLLTESFRKGRVQVNSRSVLDVCFVWHRVAKLTDY